MGRVLWVFSVRKFVNAVDLAMVMENLIGKREWREIFLMGSFFFLVAGVYCLANVKFQVFKKNVGIK